MGFTVKVTYTGNLSDDEAADLWSQIGENVKVVMTDTSVAAYTALADKSGKTQVATGGGLKFWSSNGFLTSWVNGTSSVTFTFNKGAVSFSSKVGTIGTGTLYYGAIGVDDVLQYDTDVYQVTATVSKNTQ